MAAAKECKIQESKRTQDALCSHFGQESFYRCAFLCAVTTIGMSYTPIVITALWHRCVKKMGVPGIFLWWVRQRFVVCYSSFP